MATDRPNVLWIIDDQHRGDWMGCAGAEFVRTPHLDRLAGQGMRFDACYTNSPVCGPARCSLATGLLPHRTGILSNDQAFLPVSAPTVYKHFRDHGYRVSLVGRHDLAKPGAPRSIHGNRPLNFSYGFTEALEVEGGMAVSRLDEPNGPYGAYLREVGLWEAYRADFRARHDKAWILGASHDSVLPAEHHQDAFVGRKACERIEAIEDDYPWMMFVSFQGPHDPFDPPAEFGEMYRHAELPPPVISDPSTRSRRTQRRRHVRIAPGAEPDPREVARARRQYAAKITFIDHQVGLMLDALRRRGDAENTIVVFCSDHGEMAGDHELWIKHVAYEPSWRVPLIVAGPGVATGATDALVELSDLNPTLAELCSLPVQPAQDARSFAPVVRGQADEHRRAVVTMERGYQGVRTAEDKAIFNDNDASEYYDLATDPQETTNLADRRDRRVRELRQMLHERMTEHRWMR